MVVSVIVVCVLTGVYLFIKPLLRGNNAIQIRWEGASRHIVATMAGLGAFAGLFGILQLLDLLEKQNFTWQALADIFNLSIALFAAGGVLVAASLLLYKK